MAEKRKMKIKLSEEAEKFLLAPEKYLALIGGFGSGKTHDLCELGIKCAIENTGAPGMMVAPTYKMIRDPLLNVFEGILVKEEIDYKLIKSPDIVITLFNSSHYHNHITFRSADRPKSLRGPSLSFFGIDEAAMVDREAWKDCKSRLRHGVVKAQYFKGFLGTTPEGIDDYIYEEFVTKCEDDKRKGLYNRFHIDSRDNPNNDDEYIRDLFDTYDEETQKAYILGQFIDMRHGRVYHSFGEHNLANTEFDPHLNLGLTCDFNVQPMIWEIFQYKKDYVEFIDEIVIPDNAKTEAAANIFCGWYYEKIKKLNTKIQVNIFGDASGAYRSTVGESDYIIIDDVLSNRGVPYEGFVPKGPPPIKDRINSVNSALQNREKGTRVKINPDKCKWLIKDLKFVRLTKNGIIDKRREEKQGLTHASEAAGYAIHKIMPIERPVRRQGWTSDSYW